ncbi:mediator of RNA polymerase II transcription subunit 14-like [Dorcoceras hygrometricum]|uniref:Mediator of RNA polymerase II transcription subunit 14-like n=1 Tax=Dorcoceras hygrometricum TaxID=472368 RepID=A0A2Z7CCT2_9LAMI|nr:mediator of RNA polymerase II transcription subunit 14-like [Dorcoceras hygrometricum]
MCFLGMILGNPLEMLLPFCLLTPQSCYSFLVRKAPVIRNCFVVNPQCYCFSVLVLCIMTASLEQYISLNISDFVDRVSDSITIELLINLYGLHRGFAKTSYQILYSPEAERTLFQLLPEINWNSLLTKIHLISLKWLFQREKLCKSLSEQVLRFCKQYSSNGPDLQIKCLHSVFMIDPLIGKEAEFSLDQSCIDVEMLLLRAIDCNRYTPLLEIFKELDKGDGTNQTPGDVQLQYHVNKNQADYEKQNRASDVQMYDGPEVLRVRAYGSSYFALGIKIRNA